MDRLWDPYIPNSLVALQDIADAAAKVLNEREDHYLAEYPLCSTMPISDADVAKAISKRIGKTIEARSPTFEAGVERAMVYVGCTYRKVTGDVAKVLNEQSTKGPEVMNAGDMRGDITLDEAERLILFYNRRGLKGSPNVLKWLLGRPPTTVEQWIEIQLKEAGLS